ncbi:MAG TPA: hypothetical protein PKZ02_02235 [Candidatus Paceibacterota bacterium]|nr:hypothetical protein [Candidatus Paceibacterota bacterium]
MEKQTNSSEQKPQNKNVMAAIAYVLFFIPLLTDDKKDPYVKYHVKQGLALLVLGVIVWIINSILYQIFPYYSWYIARMISWILNLGVFVLFVIGVMNALGNKEKPLPLIGKFAEKIKI